jgi:chromosome segregation ATPase
MIRSVLWQYKEKIGLGLIALLVLGYIAVLKGETTYYKNKAAQTQIKLDTANAETAAAQATVVRLNTAVQNLSDEGKRKSANARELQKKYESSVKRWQDFVGGLTAFTPNPNEGDCDAAKRLLRTARR